MSSPDIKELIEKAIINQDAPHLAKAIQGVRGFQKQSNAEIKGLMDAIQAMNGSKTAEALTVEYVQPAVTARLATDAALVEKMNRHVKENDHDTVTYPLKFNKLDLILKWTQEFDGKHFTTLWDGELPLGYEFDTEELPIMDWDSKTYSETVTIWGSSKGDVLKTELLNILMVQTGKTRVSDLDLTVGYNHWQASEAVMAGSNWTERSAIFHSTPRPATVNYEGFCKVDERFQHFSYFIHDSDKKLRFGFPHSGYAFGGQRKDRLPEKPYPQDCSSVMSQWTGCSVPYTTADQLKFYRYKQLTNPGDIWLKGPEFKPMDACYDVVTVRNPQKDIRAGQLWAVRRFKETDTAKTMEDPAQLGSGGHTALVLGFDSQAKKIHTLSCNRSYPSPEMNGIGVQSFDYPGPAHHKVMLFSVKNTSFAKDKASLVAKSVAPATDASATKPKN